MLRFCWLLTILQLHFVGFSQSVDTLRVMHYNLLNYRNTTNQCTESTNSATEKDGYLSEIVSFVEPDILTVNEMGANWLNPNKILTNALNTNGVTHFDQAEFTNNGFSSLTNMLFYNSDKLELYSQDIIDKDVNGDELVRVIDVYTLFYTQDPDLQKGDTTFLSVIVAHLKAGSNSSDKSDRALMTEAVMDYLENNKKPHSYIMGGDFNVQSANEDSYQNLTNHSNADVRFYDPVDAPGSWNNKQDYANLHTQSTHVSDTRGGCFSGGGMDDRFDFILCAREVMENTYGVRYIDGSYKALGQDSRRFNGDIISPLNSVVPNSIANALYDMSDHLPVILDLEVKKNKSNVQPQTYVNRPIITYPQHGKVLISCKREIVNIRVFDLSGRDVMSRGDIRNEREISLDVQQLTSGIYHVEVTTSDGLRLITKMIQKD